MKVSDIEKQLKKDLSASAPSDFDEVWSNCTTPAANEGESVAGLVPVTTGGTASFSSRKAVATTIAVAAVLLITAAVLCFTLLGKFGNSLILPSQSGYFIIDVNPSVRIDYNDKGVVTLAQGLNSDGEELIDGLELDGETYDKAVDAIFERCVSYGYFLDDDDDDNAILMTASKDNGEKDEKMTAEINKLLSQKFTDKKIKGVVISDVDNAKGQTDADKYGISGQKYELIQYLLEIGGILDESDYETITIKELYSLITAFEKNDKNK